MAFQRHLVQSLLFVSLFFAAPALAAPKGAVKILPSNGFQVTGSYCATIKGRLIPGRLLTGNYFYSFAAERKNILNQAKSARGKKKTQLTNKARSIATNIQIQTIICAAFNPIGTPTPVSTPTPTPLFGASPTSTPTPNNGTPLPTATPVSPAPTSTPTNTPTPDVILSTISASLAYTEHALFIIPDPSQVTWTGPASWDSVYSTGNIDSYVNTLKTAFPSDYFFVVVTASNLLPDRVPNVMTYRHVANGIGLDGVGGAGVPNICRYNTSGPPTNGVYGVLDHEIGHNWGDFLGSELVSGHWRSNSTLTGQMAENYSEDGYQTVKQITGNPTDGFHWTAINNIYKNETETFVEQDLYLQGLSSQFPPVYVLNSPVYNPDHTVSHSGVSTYDQSWVESHHGVRSPSYRTSEKKFRLGFVYIARDMAEVLEVYRPIERSIRHFTNSEEIDTSQYQFQVPHLVNTHFRGSAEALLADNDGNATPTLTITGSTYLTTSTGSALVPFTASDTSGSPIVSCVPASSNCAISGTQVILSGLTAGSHFFTIKAQDSGGKKAFAHFVVDAM